MHSRTVVRRILALSCQGTNSPRIAELVGLNRSTVSVIINKGRNHSALLPKKKLEEEMVVRGKCSGCGRETRLPCLACELNKQSTKPRVFDEEENLESDLRGDDLARFEEVCSKQVFEPSLGLIPRAGCDETVDTSLLPSDLLTEVAAEATSLL